MSGSGPAQGAGTVGSSCQESDLFQSARQEPLVELSPPKVPPEGTGGCGPGSAPTIGGVAVLEIADVHAFLVSGFEGDNTHDFICAWVSGREGGGGEDRESLV